MAGFVGTSGDLFNRTLLRRTVGMRWSVNCLRLRRVKEHADFFRRGLRECWPSFSSTPNPLTASAEAFSAKTEPLTKSHHLLILLADPKDLPGILSLQVEDIEAFGE